MPFFCSSRGITTSKLKRGRKTKHFRDSEDREIHGLARDKTSGRWRVLATGQTFREPDETKAIHRFYELTNATISGEVAGKLYTGVRSEWENISDELNAIIRANEQIFWTKVAEEIISRPKYAAEKTGIEQLAYLTDLQLPTRTAVETITTTWESNKASNKHKAKVKSAWLDFVETTGIETVRDISAEKVVAFRDNVHARGLSGKTQLHIFTGIRGILRYVKSRAIAMDEISAAINHLTLLSPDETTQSIDPQPIEVEDWKKLFDTAEGDNLAMILMMLNCGLYLQEVVRIRWEDIDQKNGCLITHRAKKGKCIRIAVLWKETLDALAGLKRSGDFLLYSYNGLPLTVSGAAKRWRKLRQDAKVSTDVEAQHLRDGAITAAAQANCEERLCKLFEGHRTTGITDKYAKRNPRMVETVCAAVRNHYLTDR